MGCSGRRIMIEDKFICIDCQSYYILDTVIVSVNDNDKVTDWSAGTVFCGDCQSESITHMNEAHRYKQLDNITNLPLIETSK